MTEDERAIINLAAKIAKRDNRYYLSPRKRFFLLGLAVGLLIGAIALTFCHS